MQAVTVNALRTDAIPCPLRDFSKYAPVACRIFAKSMKMLFNNMKKYAVSN
jgi:hypothetical protein